MKKVNKLLIFCSEMTKTSQFFTDLFFCGKFPVCFDERVYSAKLAVEQRMQRIIAQYINRIS